MCYVGGDYANDIFFSYAHGNDDLRRWSLSLSTRLRNSIETLLQVRSGELAFWTDADLEGNRQLTPNIRTNVQSSAVIIIVMSELYISSPWCQDEAAWFGEMMREGGHKDGPVFLVNALRVTDRQWPAFFADDRGERLPGYDFFDIKKPLSLPYGWYNFEDPDFGSAIVRLAEQLASYLMKFRDQVRAARLQRSPSASPVETGSSQSPGTAELSKTPRLLLGLVPEDLNEEREALAQHLQAAGFEVVAPERPFNVNEIRTVVANAAQGCAGLVQLCGRAPDFDLAVFVAAAGQSPVRQHRQGPDPAALREDHRPAPTLLRPDFDLAVLPPLASRPSASTARDLTQLPCARTTGSPVPSLGQILIMPSSPPLASPSASTARDQTQLPCARTPSGRPVNALAAASIASASPGRLILRAISMASSAKAPPSSMTSGEYA